MVHDQPRQTALIEGDEGAAMPMIGTSATLPIRKSVTYAMVDRAAAFASCAICSGRRFPGRSALAFAAWRPT